MKPWFIGSTLIGAPACWMAGASAIWCAGTGRPYEVPFLQWYQAVEAGWWHANWWCKLWIVAGGAGPTLAVVLVAVAVTMPARERLRQPKIYGDTGFASRQEMQSGGITTKKGLF